MSKEIKPVYVTYDQAVWLKEKGFDVPTLAYRQKSAVVGNETILPLALPDDEFQWKPFDWNNYSKDVPYYSIPEQWQVVEWLRVNHGIWISVDKQNYKLFKWRVSNMRLRNDAISDLIEKSDFNYDSPQEAYSAAFDYIISNNLI